MYIGRRAILQALLRIQIAPFSSVRFICYQIRKIPSLPAMAGSMRRFLVVLFAPLHLSALAAASFAPFIGVPRLSEASSLL
jgi:hypothetical protein